MNIDTESKGHGHGHGSCKDDGTDGTNSSCSSENQSNCNKKIIADRDNSDDDYKHEFNDFLADKFIVPYNTKPKEMVLGIL